MFPGETVPIHSELFPTLAELNHCSNQNSLEWPLSSSDGAVQACCLNGLERLLNRCIIVLFSSSRKQLNGGKWEANGFSWEPPQTDGSLMGGHATFKAGGAMLVCAIYRIWTFMVQVVLCKFAKCRCWKVHEELTDLAFKRVERTVEKKKGSFPSGPWH